MLKYSAFSAQDCALLEAWTLVVLTSNAWPSSKSNVTTQKQVTHLLKRSQGNTGPSYSLARNISSPSQSAIFLGPSVVLWDMQRIFGSNWRHFRKDQRHVRDAFWAINKYRVRSCVPKWRLAVMDKNDIFLILMNSYGSRSNLVTFFKLCSKLSCINLAKLLVDSS